MNTAVKEECPVCIEAYTGKARQKVTCTSCSYECCSCCVKTYLLSTTDDPHCMNCRRAWERDYLYDILSKSFVNNTLKKHRKGLLLEREKSQIPNTQTYVDYLTKREEKQQQMKQKKEEIKRLQREYEKLSSEFYTLTNFYDDKKVNVVSSQLIKCPYPSCRGYLSGRKCNICKHTTCRECMTITDIDEHGNAIVEEHICDEDAKNTAKLILKETKGCPGCGERISKVSGCDQMWCTICNVAFSWITGKIITGVIHNPHYYQWLRNGNRQQNVVRNAGDVACGGLIQIHDILRGLRSQVQRNSPIIDRILILHRSINHVQETIVNTTRRKLQYKLNLKLRDYRAKYMMNIIDESQWSRYVSCVDSEREREQALLHIYETYCTVLTERFNNFADEGRTGRNFKELLPVFVKEIKPFIAYLNEQLTRISKNYNIACYKFNNNGIISNFKIKA